MGSWLSRARVMIRDEGEAAHKGEVYTKNEKGPDGTLHKKGDLVIDELTFQPVDPPRPARNRWPDKTGVYVRPRLDGADLQMMEKLGRRADALMTELKEEQITDLHNDLEGLLPAILQLSVVVTGFACRIAKREDCASDEEFEEANLFEDPKTRKTYVDEVDEGTEGTGEVLKMPDDVIDRVKTIARLPAQIIGVTAKLYSEQQENPLPGTRVVS